MIVVDVQVRSIDDFTSLFRFDSNNSSTRYAIAKGVSLGDGDVYTDPQVRYQTQPTQIEQIATANNIRFSFFDRCLSFSGNVGNSHRYMQSAVLVMASAITAK